MGGRPFRLPCLPAKPGGYYGWGLSGGNSGEAV
jgi:hypothetical protein